jgi:hypothetical protein
MDAHCAEIVLFQSETDDAIGISVDVERCPAALFVDVFSAKRQNYSLCCNCFD